MDKYSVEAGCSCLDSAYERKAIDDGMNYVPSFSENIAYLAAKLTAHVTKQAVEVFGSEEKAQRWLNAHNLALGCAPTTLLSSFDGANEVSRILNSIAHGLFV